MEQRWNDTDRGSRRIRRETCPSATSSITNPTWTVLGANTGHLVEKPATNRLSYGTANRPVTSFVLCLDITKCYRGDRSVLLETDRCFCKAYKGDKCLEQVTVLLQAMLQSCHKSNSLYLTSDGLQQPQICTSSCSGQLRNIMAVSVFTEIHHTYSLSGCLPTKSLE
jgi:hypothetical protein